MQVKIAASWQPYLEAEFNQPYFEQLASFIKEEYRSHTIFPPAKKIFQTFELCPFEQVKVVILGQDPYHGLHQANGLSFSVNQEVRIPPSLINIFKEISDDLNLSIPNHGDLTRWAKQGVFLLNATLTVREKQPGSHQNKGWELFTDAVISHLSQHKQHIVFMLWGAYAQKKAILIKQSKHLILQSAHPSPYSAYRGFFGNRHFSQANTYLIQHGLTPIAW